MTAPSVPPRKPNPKPLALVLMFLGLSGATCTTQKMVAAGAAEAPSREDVAKQLHALGGQLPESAPPELREKQIDAAHAMTTEQARLVRNFKPFTVTFGLLLVIAYFFVMVLAPRAFARVPGTAKLLSFAALLVLPPRVAMAAVDIAVVRNLGPAVQRMMDNLASVPMPGVSPDQLAQAGQLVAALGSAAAWGAVALQGFFAIVVCAVFSYAWRYFQRPEVVALYEPPDA